MIRMLLVFLIWISPTYDLKGQITLPFQLKDGFGSFTPKLVAFSGIGEGNNTSLAEIASNDIPKTLTEVKMGSLGVIVDTAVDQQKAYRQVQKPRLNKREKVSNLNQQNSLSRLIFIYGKTPEGKYILKFDKNLDGSLMNEEEHYIGEMEEIYNFEELEKDALKLPIQTVKSGKILKRLVPFVFKVDKDGSLFYSIALHGLANIHETDIEVNFKLSTDNQNLVPHLTITDKDSKVSKTLNEKSKLFRVKDKIFKFSEMNLFEESLYLDLIPLRRATSFQKSSPSFNAKEITSGKKISLEDYEGKFLYIDFWGSWCKPCIAEIPNLRNTISILKHENIEFLGVAEDSKRAAQNAIQKFKITWPQILSGRKNSITDAFNVTSFPTTLLLAPDGQIIAENIRGESLAEKLLEEIHRYRLAVEITNSLQK